MAESASPTSASAEMIVHGYVQGVGYRYFTFRKAIELNLTGWVKNNPDGTVSIYAEGDKGLIDSFIDELKIGPRASSVTDIKISYGKYSGQFNGFNIR